MTYKDFKEKWDSLWLVTNEFGVPNTTRGQLNAVTVNDFSFYNDTPKFKADLWFTPHYMGWQDEKQRREFYKDAKSAGVKAHPTKRMLWYKDLTTQP